MIKADWTGGSMRRSRFAKLNIQHCAVALCAAGAVAGPAAASTLNTIFRTDLPGFQILGYPLAVAGGQVIDVASAGAGNNGGKLFVLTPGKAGAQYTRTVLHHFDVTTASTDGEAPNFDLIADAAGNVWGTTGGRAVGGWDRASAHPGRGAGRQLHRYRSGARGGRAPQFVRDRLARRHQLPALRHRLGGEPPGHKRRELELSVYLLLLQHRGQV